jgi:uncharacterized phage protein (TIGR02218 family)
MTFDLNFQNKLLASGIQSIWLISIQPNGQLGLPANATLRFCSLPYDFQDSNGDTWYGGFILDHSALENSQSGASGNSDLTLRFGRTITSIPSELNALYSPDPFLLGMYRNATVKRALVLPPYTGSLNDGNSLVYWGFVGDIDNKAPNRISLEIRGVSEPLQANQGHIVSKFCPYTLGDDRCGVALRTNEETVLLHTLSNATSLTVTNIAAVQPAWVAGGVVRVTAYFGTQPRYDVGYPYPISYAVNQGSDIVLILDQSVPIRLNPGDRVDVTQSCNKSTQDCTRYGNLLRYGGFPLLPGNLNIYKTIVS